MKIVHVQGFEIGGQRHRIILEEGDGFVRDGSSVFVDTTVLDAAMATIEAQAATITALESTVADLEARVSTLEEPAQG